MINLYLIAFIVSFIRLIGWIRLHWLSDSIATVEVIVISLLCLSLID